MRTRRWIAGAGAGTLLLAGVVTGGPLVSASLQDATPAAEVSDDAANATPVVGTPLLAPAIDLAQAQEAALVGQDGAVVTSVKLDGDEGTLTYDVVLDNGVEVEVDATTGALGETEQAGSDEADDEDTGTDDKAADDNGADGEADDGDDQGDGDGETNDDQGSDQGDTGDQGDDQAENEDA